jgi:hypothetical protein
VSRRGGLAPNHASCGVLCAHTATLVDQGILCAPDLREGAERPHKDRLGRVSVDRDSDHLHARCEWCQGQGRVRASQEPVTQGTWGDVAPDGGDRGGDVEGGAAVGVC